MQQPSNENPSWDEEKWERFFFSQEAEAEGEEDLDENEYDSCYLEDLFVYQLAKDFADEAAEYAKGIRSKQREVRQTLERLTACAAMVSAHIAAGHALGYEPETIGGNTALCRRGAQSLKEAQEALKQIHARYGVTIGSLHLNQLAEEVRIQLDEWVRELRGKKEPE